MSTEALWDFGRGSGVVALVLVTVSVVLGILTRRGEPIGGLPRFAVTEVHRNASLLSVAFLALHAGLLMFDPYAQLRIFDAVVPFAAGYRPFWQGLGTVALDLIVALVVTSLLRHRLGRRVWRAIHWLAYALWPLAVAHAVGTGTDASSAWFLALATVCVVTVAGAAGWRFTRKELAR